MLYPEFAANITKLSGFVRSSAIGEYATPGIRSCGNIHFTSRKGEGTSFTVGLILLVSGGEEAYDTLALADRRALLADDDSDVGTEAVA